MERFIVFLFSILLASTIWSYASPPSRSYVYQPGDPIVASEVTANEDSIFNYLQSGVDNIADGSIVNADINATANIQSTKLNLTSVSQNISNTGTLTNTGTVTITGDVAVTGSVVVSSGTIDGIGAVPIGGIIMWSGSVASIPTGWELSDGTCAISCPDLRDRFVVGSGSTYAVGATGGATTHVHSVPYSGWSGYTPTGYRTGELALASDEGNFYSSLHATSNQNSGSSSSLPPYYSLAYIIRVQ
jgi:hypothetical protein